MKRAEWVKFYWECHPYIHPGVVPCLQKAFLVRHRYPTLDKLSHLSELELLILADLMLQDQGSDEPRIFVEEGHFYREFEDEDCTRDMILNAAFRLENEKLIERFVNEETCELFLQPKNHNLWQRGLLTPDHEPAMKHLKIKSFRHRQTILN